MKSSAVVFAVFFLAITWEAQGQVNETEETARCGDKVDVVFLLDTSKSFKDRMRRSKTLLRRVVANHNTSIIDDRIRVAIGKIDKQMVLKRKLSSNNTAIAPIQSAIKSLKCCVESTNLGRALDELPQVFLSQEGGRPGAKRYAVFLSDGLPTHTTRFPIDVAQNLTQHGIEVIFVVYYDNRGQIRGKQNTAVDKMITNPKHKLDASSPTVVPDLARLMGLPECPTPPPTTPKPATKQPVCEVPKTPLSVGCEDKYPGCEQLGSQVCTSLEPWARIYCAGHCKFCSVSECEDVVGNCAMFGDTICSAAPLSTWVDAHCRKFCNRC